MGTVAYILMIGTACGLPYGPKSEPWANSASGDDGRVRVTVSVYESMVAPGEICRLSADMRVLVDGPLRFPQRGYHQPLAFLYLRTPNGKVVVYPQRGVSPKSYRPLEPKDYKRFFLFKKGIGGPVIAYDIPMVNPSPEWRDPDTGEIVQPNLRTEGKYEAWVKYTIPKFEGIPDDAWHGEVVTKPVRFTVRAIPVAKRRAKATPEQIAHLQAYKKNMSALIAGKIVKADLPKSVEMPEYYSLDQRLQWALQQTKNEGFARYVVEQLRKHQPKMNQPYPAWWGNVDFFVQHHRAYRNDYRGRAFKIIGPYLDDYAKVAAVEMKHDLERRFTPSQAHNSGYYLHFLIDYVKLKPKSDVRKQLELLGRRYGKIPANAKSRDHKVRDRVTTAWQLLFALDLLYDKMLFTDAKKILGTPTVSKEDKVIWNYTVGSRAIERGVYGRIVLDNGRETIVFSRNLAWTF